MRAVAEADVDRGPGEVQGVGAFEELWVPIGRFQDDVDVLTTPDELVVDGYVRGGFSEDAVVDNAEVPNQLVDTCIHDGRVGNHPLGLARVLQQGIRAEGNHVCGGVVSSCKQQ